MYTDFVPKVEDLTNVIQILEKDILKFNVGTRSWVYLSTYKAKLCQGQVGASSKLNHILESFVVQVLLLTSKLLTTIVMFSTKAEEFDLNHFVKGGA